MQPLYENSKNSLEAFTVKSRHIPPHLHRSMECILVTNGTLEVGVAQELFHMEKGDFALIFPDMVHHYQVFSSGPNRAIYLLASPSLSGGYMPLLQKMCPRSPVISRDNVHPDIVYSMNSLLKNDENTQAEIIHQAFIQLLLARSIPCLELIEKSFFESHDLIFQVVTYIARHFMEQVTLTTMAKDLGYSPYTLSRVFSNVFHSNFNKYLNDARLDYACTQIQYSSKSITDILYESGFESQRTFNRVFKERYHVTPREYKKSLQE